jgi:O-antigen ligase
MNSMHQDALIRRNPAFEQWAIPIAIGAVAIFIGVVVGQGKWIFVPAVALLPLLWFWPVEVAMGAAVVLLPFEYVTMLGVDSGGGTDRTLMSVAILLAFSVLCAVGVAGRRLQRPSAIAIWWGLFTLWCALTILWAVEPRKSLELLPSVVALFLFYLVASSFRITEKELDRIVTLAILGGAAAATWSLYSHYFGAGFAQHQLRATLANGREVVNPNRFGSCMLIPLSLALARFLSARHRWTRVMALGLFGIISIGLILTMSRGSILAAVVTVSVFFWRLNSLKLKSMKPKVRRFLFVGIVLVLVAAATVPAGLVKRFGESASDRGAGRFDIWTVGLAVLQDYAVFGAGLNNFPVVYNKYAGYASHQDFSSDRDPHNVYLGVSVEEGVVGLFLFLMALRSQFKIVAKVRARTPESSTLLIACEATCWGVLVASIFGTFLWDKVFWIAWVLLAFTLTVQTAKSSPERRFARKLQPDF